MAMNVNDKLSFTIVFTNSRPLKIKNLWKLQFLYKKSQYKITNKLQYNNYKFKSTISVHLQKIGSTN